jgi:hypothetical protein
MDFWAHPITGPSYAYFPPEIHYFPLHNKNRCIGNFMYMSFRAHIYVYGFQGPQQGGAGGKVICGR